MALNLLVRHSNCHLYYVQLFADSAGGYPGGEPTFTLAYTQAGLASARAEPVLQYEVVWARLRPQERDYLAAVATLSGQAARGSRKWPRRLGKEAKLLAVARDQFVHNHGLLDGAPPHSRPSPHQQSTPCPDPVLPMARRRLFLSKRAVRSRRARPVAGPTVRPPGHAAVSVTPAERRAGPETSAADAPGSSPDVSADTPCHTVHADQHWRTKRGTYRKTKNN